MRILITGGAGFIGCNAAARFIQRGDEVTVLDNLSRPGAGENLRWLNSLGGCSFIKGDVRDSDLLNKIFSSGKYCMVLHFAAQVAVTDSVQNPRQDFEANALGTFNLLEAVRQSGQDPIFIFSSTNKVYGSLDDIALGETKARYKFLGNRRAISEKYMLDFHSPYGCSKGCADQYVRDYARMYGMPTIVLRQSCVYGPRQFGVEDQGWVAWFLIAHLLHRPITIYGDGKQVRDILYIDDLLDCIDRVIEGVAGLKGEIFNIGGGPGNAVSLLDFLDLLSEVTGRKPQFRFDDWRPGDQRIYISDVSKAKRILEWEPRVGVREGVRRLYDWVSGNMSEIKEVLSSRKQGKL